MTLFSLCSEISGFRTGWKGKQAVLVFLKISSIILHSNLEKHDKSLPLIESMSPREVLAIYHFSDLYVLSWCLVPTSTLLQLWRLCSHKCLWTGLGAYMVASCLFSFLILSKFIFTIRLPENTLTITDSKKIFKMHESRMRESGVHTNAWPTLIYNMLFTLKYPLFLKYYMLFHTNMKDEFVWWHCCLLPDPKIFLNNIYWSLMCAWKCGHACAIASVWSSEDNVVELLLFFYLTEIPSFSLSLPILQTPV